MLSHNSGYESHSVLKKTTQNKSIAFCVARPRSAIMCRAKSRTDNGITIYQVYLKLLLVLKLVMMEERRDE